jgi:Luciferase-like monooxygenase
VEWNSDCSRSSVLAAPLVVASALAARTQRVKIGIAVQVLPLSHPLRLAEDVATADGRGARGARDALTSTRAASDDDRAAPASMSGRAVSSALEASRRGHRLPT